MKPNTLFQVRFRPSVTPPRGWAKSAHYTVLNYDRHHDKYLIGKTWLPAKDFIKIEVQDAPVFDKPVLRKIASLKENECIEIPNDTIRDLVLEQAEREGLVWRSDSKKPLEIKHPTPFYLYNRASIGSLTWWPLNPMKSDTILPASKFVEVPQEKEEPITEPQKDDCKEADERIKELENDCINVRQVNNDLFVKNDKLYAELETIKRLAKIAIQHEDYEHMRVILKSIATGEI